MKPLLLSAFVSVSSVLTAAAGQHSPAACQTSDTDEIVQLMTAQPPRDYRTIDGTANNRRHPDWGASDTELLRLCGVYYGDGANTPAGANRVSPRAISDVCAAQAGSLPNSRGASDYLWQWGQFLDHDMDLTPVISPFEEFSIPIPKGDPYFDPLSTGTQVMSFERSFYHTVNGVRQQVNDDTSYIDGSNVYGSDPARAAELRTRDGTGRLRTGQGDLLPFNTHGFPNSPDTTPAYFLAGDVRANEQVGLTALQTLWLREHNFWADQFHQSNPRLNDEQIYQLARTVVVAEMQAITYREFLPVLLGPGAIPPFKGYRPEVNAGIANEFSTAAYRVGHTLLSPTLLRLQSNGQPIPAGNLPLSQAFFSPDQITQEGGIDPLLRGLAAQTAQEIDGEIVDGVRNFLFGPPGAGGFDLASLNIQRGRDHGLPGYNQGRRDLGLRPVRSFSQINSRMDVQAGLALAYPTVEDIDLWMGGLCEEHVPGAMVGELFFTLLENQFERLRDGDRFYYENYLPDNLVQLIERQTLATVIRRNTGIGNEIQDDVFLVPQPEPAPGHRHSVQH